MSNTEKSRENEISNNSLFRKVFGIHKLYTIYDEPISEGATAEKMFSFAKAGFAWGVINYAGDFIHPFYRSEAAIIAKRTMPAAILAGSSYGLTLWGIEQVTEKKGGAVAHGAAGAVMGFVHAYVRYLGKYTVGIKWYKPFLFGVFTYSLALNFALNDFDLQGSRGTFKKVLTENYTTAFTAGPLRCIDDKNERRGLEL